MAVSIITALREFNMNTDSCIQIKSEPFESSSDLYPLESRNDYDVAFTGYSFRRTSECSECNGRTDYDCSSCMCQVCFNKTNAEKRYRCSACRKVFHEWCCRNNRDSSVVGNKWLCAKCKGTDIFTEDVDVKDFDSDFIASNLRRLQESDAFDKKPDLAKLNRSLARESASLETRMKLRSYHSQSQASLSLPDDKSQIVDKVFKKFIRKMNNAPRSKICITVPSNHFGPIPGIPVGTCWKFRLQVSESGVHRPLVAGIHGRENEGAYSIVLSGVYQDDQDNGDEFYYSGCGGKEKDPRKRLSKQIKDQELTRLNKALAVCCNAPVNDEHGAEAKNWKAGKPVRVIRNYKLRKFSAYAPEEGNRYDGIYKVVKYFPTTGTSGLLIWRYLLRRDDPEPAPWTDEGQKVIQEKNLKVIYPDDIENEDILSSSQIKRERSPRKKPYDYSLVPRSPRGPANLDGYRENSFSEESAVADNAPDIDVKPDINQLRASVFGFSNVVTRSMMAHSKSTSSIDGENVPMTAIRKNTENEFTQPDTSCIRVTGIRSMANLDQSTSGNELACNASVQNCSTLGESGSVGNGAAKGTAISVTDPQMKNEKVHLDESVRQLIEMDTLNKAIWDYCNTYLSVGEKEFLNVVKIMFTCQRCLKLADCPVTMPCDHNVCLECITNHFAEKLYSCPTCHYYLGPTFKLKENKNLASILEAIFPAYNFKLSKFM